MTQEVSKARIDVRVLALWIASISLRTTTLQHLAVFSSSIPSGERALSAVASDSSACSPSASLLRLLA